MQMTNREFAQQIEQRRRADAIAEAKQACATMQSFLDDAKKRVEQAEAGDSFYTAERIASTVLHQLSWGLANATGHIQNAISRYVESVAARVESLTAKEEAGDDRR